MNLYKLNRSLHRDLGYFFVGMSLIYAISGIALNHIKDWNPNYIIEQKTYQTNSGMTLASIDNHKIQSILKLAGEEDNYKNHYFPTPERMKVFVEGGNISVDLPSGECTLETNRRRPIFFEVNKLHYNPGVLWLYFSDFFCVSLAFLAISGLFILKGKNGLKWRGAILGTLGIVIPLIFLLYYL